MRKKVFDQSLHYIKLKGKNDKSVLIDIDMFDYLNQWNWYLHIGGYAYSVQYIIGSGKRNQKTKKTYMHRLIMNTPQNMETDHINGDKLDNRRENLRICTQSQNTANRLRKDNKSGFKGVRWHKRDKIWRTEIWVSQKNIYLGSFSTAIEAFVVYKQAATKYFGEFAKF